MGKSSLLTIMRGGEFSEKTEATFGVDFSQHHYTTGKDQCRATIYDTSGQPHLKDTVRTQVSGRAKVSIKSQPRTGYPLE